MSTYDDYVASIKSAFVTLGDGVAYGLVVSYLPFLGWPIVNIATKYIINRLLTDITQQAELGAFFLFVDFRVSAQSGDFLAAVDANHKAQSGGTAKEKADAEAALKLAFKSFAKLQS